MKIELENNKTKPMILKNSENLKDEYKLNINLKKICVICLTQIFFCVLKYKINPFVTLILNFLFNFALDNDIRGNISQTIILNFYNKRYAEKIAFISGFAGLYGNHSHGADNNI